MNVLTDHGGYWANPEGFLVPLVRHIDAARGDAVASRFYRDPALRTRRIVWRRQRVAALAAWGWLCSLSAAATVAALVDPRHPRRAAARERRRRPGRRVVAHPGPRDHLRPDRRHRRARPGPRRRRRPRRAGRMAGIVRPLARGGRLHRRAVLRAGEDRHRPMARLGRPRATGDAPGGPVAPRPVQGRGAVDRARRRPRRAGPWHVRPRRSRWCWRSPSRAVRRDSGLGRHTRSAPEPGASPRPRPARGTPRRPRAGPRTAPRASRMPLRSGGSGA